MVPTLLLSQSQEPLHLDRDFIAGILGMIGFFDDFRKLKGQNRKISQARPSCSSRSSLPSWSARSSSSQSGFLPELTIPFFKNLTPICEPSTSPCACFSRPANPDGVNLTDGLDSLAMQSGHNRLFDLPPFPLYSSAISNSLRFADLLCKGRCGGIDNPL